MSVPKCRLVQDRRGATTGVVLRALLAVICSAWVALTALDVEEVRWGFDDSVRPDTVNPLAVRVSNPSPVAWSGMFVLSRGFPAPIGEKLVTQVDLQPGGQRWLRFSPWLGPHLGFTSWTLSWQGSDGRGSFDVGSPSEGAPAVVWVDSGRGGRRGGLVGFPAQLLPTSAGLMDGLRALVLDHEPRIAGAQRQALLDWLWAGGTVVLCQGPGGELPRLGPLWGPLATDVRNAGPVGTGRLIIRSNTIDELNGRILRELDLGPIDDIESSMNQLYGSYGSGSMASHYFPTLRSLTRPDHSWGILTTLLLIYVATLFPTAWLLGKIWDYRLVTLGQTGVMVLFAVVVSWVGQRGYGEREVVHSVALARDLGQGRWDLAQWGSLFVTTATRRTLIHGAPDQVPSGTWASCDEEGRVPMVVPSGAGLAVLDLPLYSAQTWHYRGSVEAEGPNVRVLERDANSLRLRSLEVAIGGINEPGPAWVAMGDFVYEMEHRGNGIWAMRGSGKLLRKAFEGIDQMPFTFGWGRVPAEAGDSHLMDTMAGLLFAWRSGGRGIRHDIQDLPLAPQQGLRLWVTDRAATGLQPKDTVTGTNVVVYEMGVPLRAERNEP